jgi:hypothetical protein
MTYELTTTRKPTRFDTNLSSASSNQELIVNPRRASRTTLAQLHSATMPDADSLKNTALSKGFALAKDGLASSLESSLKILSGGSNGLIDFAKKTSDNKNIRSMILASVGSLFGLGFFKDILKVPKLLTDKNPNDKQAPMLLKASKWIAGGALSYGALRALLSGAGMANPTILVGVVAFLALQGTINFYENENSIFSKFLKILGIRDDLKTAIDDFKSDKLTST